MSKRHRRRSSNSSKNPSPNAGNKKPKIPSSPAAPIGSPSCSQSRRSLEIRSVTGGLAVSTITEAGTAENHSVLDGFGDDDFTVPTDATPRLAAKLPPLVVQNYPLARLKKDLREKQIDAQFKLTRMGIKIIAGSKPSLAAARNYLRQVKAQFYTHDAPEEKPFKAVVRGLPIMPKEDIVDELAKRYKLHPVAIHVIARKASDGEYCDCLYLVHFRRGSTTINALKAVRSLNDMIVSWEPYRGSTRDVTQCMRCMHFGHGTRNCSLRPRCNNCAGSHTTADCHQAEEASIKCANCGGAHKASQRSCPKREAYKRIRKEAATRNLPGRRAPTNRHLYRQEDFPALQPIDNQPHHQHAAPSWPGRTRQNASINAAPQLDQLDQQQWAAQAGQDEPKTSAPPGPSHHPPKVSVNSPIGESASENDGVLYSPEQLVRIFLDMSDRLKQCRSRHEQIETLGVFIIKYGQ